MADDDLLCQCGKPAEDKVHRDPRSGRDWDWSPTPDELELMRKHGLHPFGFPGNIEIGEKQARASAAMQAAGFSDVSQSELEQMVVFLECFELFREKNKTYQDLWRVDGWIGIVHHIRHKSLRIWRLFGRHQDDEAIPKDDDAYDLINYLVFFLRLLRAGNKYGSE